MKITRANVEKWAEERGMEAVQIDTIPEGFSFKEADVTIGGTEHKGQYVAYVPLSDWTALYANSVESLKEQYKKYA